MESRDGFIWLHMWLHQLPVLNDQFWGNSDRVDPSISIAVGFVAPPRTGHLAWLLYFRSYRDTGGLAAVSYRYCRWRVGESSETAKAESRKAGKLLTTRSHKGVVFGPQVSG